MTTCSRPRRLCYPQTVENVFDGGIKRESTTLGDICTTPTIGDILGN